MATIESLYNAIHNRTHTISMDIGNAGGFWRRGGIKMYMKNYRKIKKIHIEKIIQNRK